MQADTSRACVEEWDSLTVQSLPVVSYTADLEKNLSGPRFLSPSIAEAIGFGSNAFIEDPDLWLTRVHPDDLGCLHDHLRRIGEKGSSSVDYRWCCADGSWRVFLDQAVLVRNELGTPREICGTCLDITYRRQIEQQLQQSQKMAAFGQFVDSFTHDFNNMLNVVMWNLGRLERSLENAGKDHERVQAAIGGALKCTDLLRQMSAFARQPPDRARVIDLCNLVPQMVCRMGALVGEEIRIELEMPEKLRPIYADPIKIETALLNLAISARSAMSSRGALSIECADVCGDNTATKPFLGAFVMISVRHTEADHPSDAIKAALDPCCVAQEPSMGEGIGLRMVSDFVNRSGGYANTESAPGFGTTVRLYFPATDLPPEKTATVEKDKAFLTSIENFTILMVEDNPHLRRMAVAHMESAGYRVLAAENTTAALGILHADQTVGLLFTDVVMPGGMDGFALAQRAAELNPGIKILFTSGYISSDHRIGDSSDGFLQKPYTEQDLLRALISIVFEGGGRFVLSNKRGGLSFQGHRENPLKKSNMSTLAGEE